MINLSEDVRNHLNLKKYRISCDRIANNTRHMTVKKDQKAGQISKKALKHLKSRLPKGFTERANIKLGLWTGNTYHRSTFYRVLKGEIINQKILDVLIEIAHKEDLRKEKLEKEAQGIRKSPFEKCVVPVIKDGKELFCIGYKVGNENPALVHWRGERIEFETAEEAEEYLKDE